MKSSLVIEQRKTAAFLWDEVQRDTRMFTLPVQRLLILVLGVHGTLILLPMITLAQLSISLAASVLVLIIVRLLNAVICLQTVYKPEGVVISFFRYRTQKVFLHCNEIRSAELIRFPFWRRLKGGPTYRVYGRRGIAFHLKDGSTVYLGTQERKETLKRVLTMYQ
ncbi:MAG: hypothetical protein HRU40_06680 [Saprospiraceae bacterium]|nr:hypothetical protein [Saprospiraceae bacterium]